MSSLESLINEVAPNKVSLVVQVCYHFYFSKVLGECISNVVSVKSNYFVTVKVSCILWVSQGYFAPAVVKYARTHQEKLNDLILLNPPVRVL